MRTFEFKFSENEKLDLLESVQCLYKMLRATFLLMMLALMSTSMTLSDKVSDEQRFLFWKDYPGSDEYNTNKPQWYDTLLTRAGESFETSRDWISEKLNVEVQNLTPTPTSTLKMTLIEGQLGKPQRAPPVVGSFLYPTDG